MNNRKEQDNFGDDAKARNSLIRLPGNASSPFLSKREGGNMNQEETLVLGEDNVIRSVTVITEYTK
jgi:hypothetical protein